MKKYLVIGDSYGLFDPEHKHWLDLWAEEYNYEVDHMAIPGGNHVNISAHVQDIDFSKYSGVIYQFTSLLRTEIINQPSVHKERISTQIDMLTKPFGRLEFDDGFVDLCLSNDVDYLIKQGKNYIVRNYAFGDLAELYKTEFDYNDISLNDTAINFYKSVSVRWLFRANWYAFERTVNAIKRYDVPLLIVFPPCGGFKIIDEKLKKSNVKTWDMEHLHPVSPFENTSANHITKHDALIFARLFEESEHKIDFI